MSRLVNLVTILIALVLASLGIAQETVPPVAELFNTPWEQLLTEIGALSGLLTIVVKVAGEIKPDIFTGPAKYFLAVGLGALIGGAGDFMGILSAAEYSAMPTPLGGLTYGLVAGLSAVGLNQGKRQTGVALRETSQIRTRR